MFITQQLKNKRNRRRRDKQVSVIISETRGSIRASQQLFSKERNNLILKKQIENKMRKFDHYSPHNFGFIDSQEPQNHHLLPSKHRPLTKENKKINVRQLKMKSKLTRVQPIKPSHREINRNKSMPSLQSPYSINAKVLRGPDLRDQNIKKLQTFIKGAYHSELDEYSEFVNLSSVDQFRKDFYIFDNLYRWASQANESEKMGINDVRDQNLRGIVYLNDEKQNTGIPQLSNTLKKLKVLR